MKHWSAGVDNVRRVIDEADEPRRRSWVGDTVINAVTRVGDRVGGRVGSAAFVSAGLAPIYFTVSWWLAGRTFGGNLAGFVVCAQDGEQLRFRNSVDVYRRGWPDLLTRTRTPYRVHVQVRPETLATAVPAS